MSTPSPPPSTATEPPSGSTLLALDRTRLALERTMMAWVRTATSMITFGFTLYKFFQFENKNPIIQDPLVGPRTFGLMMISFGVVSLLLATLQHWQSMRALKVHYAGLRMPLSIAAVLATLISLFGVLALLAVAFRH